MLLELSFLGYSYFYGRYAIFNNKEISFSNKKRDKTDSV